LAFGHDKGRRKNRSREGLLRAAVRSGERRRTVRRRVVAALVTLIGLPALAVGLWWGGHQAWLGMFAENPFFEIKRIEITTDGMLGVGDVQEYARVRPGLNLFAVRPQDVRAALLTVPVIADAQVGRRLPDGLVIEVTERIAVARLGRPGAGSTLAVDATGHVLGPSSVRVSLPVVLGVRDVGLRPGDVVADPCCRKRWPSWRSATPKKCARCWPWRPSTSATTSGSNSVWPRANGSCFRATR
jgi:cell division septal protein FtsQ